MHTRHHGDVRAGTSESKSPVITEKRRAGPTAALASPTYGPDVEKVWKTNNRPDLLAATPPLEGLKLVLSEHTLVTRECAQIVVLRADVKRSNRRTSTRRLPLGRRGQMQWSSVPVVGQQWCSRIEDEVIDDGSKEWEGCLFHLDDGVIDHGIQKWCCGGFVSPDKKKVWPDGATPGNTRDQDSRRLT